MFFDFEKFIYLNAILFLLLCLILGQSGIGVVYKIILSLLILAILIRRPKLKIIGVLGVLFLSFGAIQHENNLKKMGIGSRVSDQMFYQIRVVSPVDHNETFYKFLGNIEELDTVIMFSGKQPMPTIDYGDICAIQFKLNLEPVRFPGEFQYTRFLRSQNIWGQARILEIQKTGQFTKNPLKQLAYYLKPKIVALNQRYLAFPYSEIFTALIFGTHGVELPKDFSERFKQLGLTHLLVVSGSQVALLGGIVYNILRPLVHNRIVFFNLQSVALWSFYFLTGGGFSIFRAVLMAEVMLIFKLFPKNIHPIHALSFTLFILVLIWPAAIADAGAQLSFLASAALIFGIEPFSNRITFLPNWLKEPLLLAIVPFLWTTPILWAHFGVISPFSIISNLVVSGWLELVVVWGFFSDCIGLVLPSFAGFFLKGLGLVLLGLDWITLWLASFQDPLRIRPLPLWGTSFIYIFILIQFFKVFRKQWIRQISLFFFLGILIGQTYLYWFPPYLKIMVTDVGQGDAVLVMPSAAHSLLIDAGGFSSGGFKKPGEIVSDALAHLGIYHLWTLVLTHYDADHVQGMAAILDDKIKVDHFIDNSDPNLKWDDLRQQIIQNSQTYHPTGTMAYKCRVGETFIQIFRPFDSEKENDLSITTHIRFGAISFLFTGDLESEGEVALLDYLDTPVTVYKLGHHGSKTSTSEYLLDQIKPQIGVVSAGFQNRYGHPHRSVMDRCRDKGLSIYRTDEEGSIIFLTNGKKLWVRKTRSA